MNSLYESSRQMQDGTLNFRKNELMEYYYKNMALFNEKTGFCVDVVDEYQDYLNYLSSIEWKEKRKLVLKRDKNICQSCLSKKATQVHHLNYKTLKNEPLFDLVSVCGTCHISITKMHKGEEAKMILHSTLLQNVLNR